MGNESPQGSTKGLSEQTVAPSSAWEALRETAIGRWRVVEKRRLSSLGSPGPRANGRPLRMGLLEAGPAPGQGVGAQGRQGEGDPRRPREERDTVAPALGRRLPPPLPGARRPARGRPAGALCPTPALGLWLGMRWGVSGSLFPIGLRSSVLTPTRLHQEKGGVASATEPSAGENSLQGRVLGLTRDRQGGGRKERGSSAR